MRRSVSATARRFASSSATTVRACCSCTRSQSVNDRPSVASSTASPGAWTPTSSTIASASGTARPAAASTLPSCASTRMRPPIAAAASAAIASRPASSSTSSTSRSCSSTARASWAYCSFTIRVMAASVMATNGVS